MYALKLSGCAKLSIMKRDGRYVTETLPPIIPMSAAVATPVVKPVAPKAIPAKVVAPVAPKAVTPAPAKVVVPTAAKAVTPAPAPAKVVAPTPVITKPTISQLGIYQEPINYHLIAASGNYVYGIIDEERYLGVIDTSKPTAPVLTKTFSTYTDLYHIATTHDKVPILIVATKNTVTIFNISKPLEPIMIHSFKVDGVIEDLSVVGNTFYLAMGSLGYKAYEIGNATPKETSVLVAKKIHSVGSSLFVLSESLLTCITGKIVSKVAVVDAIGMEVNDNCVALFTKKGVTFYKFDKEFSLVKSVDGDYKCGSILNFDCVAMVTDDQLRIYKDAASKPFVCEKSTYINDVILTSDHKIYIAAENEFIVAEVKFVA